MTLSRVADGLDTLVQKKPQHASPIVARPAYLEVVGAFAPIFLQPLDVGFEASARDDEAFCPYRLNARRPAHVGAPEAAVGNVEINDFGVIFDTNAEARGGA